MHNNGSPLAGFPEGIVPHAKRMPNGEVRARISHSASGLSTSITSTAKKGARGWQNSHRHVSGLKELYAIQSGWVAVATLAPDGSVRYEGHAAGAFFVLASSDPHTLYVAADTVFATVKYGSGEGRRDWEPCPELDALVSSLAEEEVLRLCRANA